MHMSGIRIFSRSLVCLIAAAVCAQSTDPSTDPKEPTFNVRVTNIVVPLTVHDRDGNIVNGLQPREFHLTDNGKEQNLAVDVTYHPVSLVIAIQRVSMYTTISLAGIGASLKCVNRRSGCVVTPLPGLMWQRSG